MKRTLPLSGIREQLVGGFRVRRSHYPPNFKFARHAHEHLLVYQVCDGSIDEAIGRQTLSCSAGSVVVMPAGVDHVDQYGPTGAANLAVAISAEAWHGVADELKISAPVHFADRSLGTLLAEAEQEAVINDSDSPAALGSLMIEVLISAQIRKYQQANRPAWMQRVLSRLHDCPTQAVSLEQLGVVAGVHPVHLAATFRRSVGCTVGAYMRRLRIAQALRLLRSTDESVADIATACGFADQSHLCRVFRSATASSPSVHRSHLRTRTPFNA